MNSYLQILEHAKYLNIEYSAISNYVPLSNDTVHLVGLIKRDQDRIGRKYFQIWKQCVLSFK